MGTCGVTLRILDYVPICTCAKLKFVVYSTLEYEHLSDKKYPSCDMSQHMSENNLHGIQMLKMDTIVKNICKIACASKWIYVRLNIVQYA